MEPNTKTKTKTKLNINTMIHVIMSTSSRQEFPSVHTVDLTLESIQIKITKLTKLN